MLICPPPMCFQIKKWPLRRQACGFHSVKRISGQAPCPSRLSLAVCKPQGGSDPEAPAQASFARSCLARGLLFSRANTHHRNHRPPTRGADPGPSAQGEGSSHGVDDPYTQS